MRQAGKIRQQTSALNKKGLFAVASFGNCTPLVRILQANFRSGFCCLVALAMLMSSGGVLAEEMSVEDQKAILNQWTQYQDDTGVCSPDDTSVDVELEGRDNHEKAFNFFTGKGFTPEQSVGIVANLIAESDVIPNRKQGSGMQTIQSYEEIRDGNGFGIAQWTFSSRQIPWIKMGIKEAGFTVKDDIYDYSPEEKKKISAVVLSLQLQLEYLLYELESNPANGLPELKKPNAKNDARQATWIFLSYFERPASVIDSGYVATPTQPPAGNAAHTTLNERMVGVEGLLKKAGASSGTGEETGDVGDCPNGSELTGGEGRPSFKANLKVGIDEADREGECTGDFTVGAQSLKKYVENRWMPPVTSVGGYACRSIVGGSSLSLHAVGRAIDIMVSATNPKGLATGDEIRNFMINNSTQLGVQRVIWNRHIWSADQNGWRPYGGPGMSPHTDHLHVEINYAASKKSNLAGGV